MKWHGDSTTQLPVTHGPSNRTPAKVGQALLVLDGPRITPESLSLALAGCLRNTHRLDILLVNPPIAPTTLLRALLLRLEHAGIDYRLTSVEGDLQEQLVLYLKRFLAITTVLVENLVPLEDRMGCALVADLRSRGYRFLSY